MTTIRLDRDEITPHLQKLLRQASRGGPLFDILGRAGANALRQHYRTLNTSRANAMGGARTNFWSRVAQSVNAPRTRGRDIVIPVSHPAIAQKLYGGTITARKAKNLAIPISPKAHGKSPRVFQNLQFAKTSGGTKLLGLRGPNGGIDWLYVLKKSVTQARDPEAVPPPSVMEKALTRAAGIHLRRL